MQITFKRIFIIYTISTILFLVSGFPHHSNSSSCPDSLRAPDQTLINAAEIPTLISVYRTETKTISIVPFEKYVRCVVASEVPGGFHEEAIKAQSVAARTYAASKVNESSINGCPEEHPLTPLCDSTHCQVYTDETLLSKKSNWDKVSAAVKSTDSQMLYYNNELVKYALFHASSGGKTENSEDVFVSAVPYLKSVESPYEEAFSRNGHGVGMSQQGANGMANAGYTYIEILSHYYSGVTVH